MDMDARTRLLLEGYDHPLGMVVDDADHAVMQDLVEQGLFTVEDGSYEITAEGDDEGRRLDREMRRYRTRQAGM